MTNQSNLISNYKLSLFILGSFLLKLLIAYKLPLFGDEAYYTIWGQHLQLSYFDHPPMVAWLTKIGLLINEFIPVLPLTIWVRLPFITVSTFSLYVYFLIYKNELSHVDKTTNYIAYLLLFLLNPLIGLGGLVATPDVGLVLFWGLSYYAVIQIIRNQKTIWYILLGLFLGLGFCAKYHIILFPLTAVLALFIEKRFYQIQFKKLIFTFIFGLLFSLPVILWNYQNDWVSFKFQFNHGFVTRKYDILFMLTYFIGQILLFNPFLLIQIIKKSKTHLSSKIALLQWLFFSYSSTKAPVEANWPITAHAQGLSSTEDIKPDYLRNALIYYLVLWTAFLILYNTPYGEKKLSRLPNSIIAEDIANQTKIYRPLFGPTYQMSSLLSVVTKEDIYKLKDLSRIDFYDHLQPQIPDYFIFYVLKYDFTAWPEWISQNAATYSISTQKAFTNYSMTLYKIEVKR